MPGVAILVLAPEHVEPVAGLSSYLRACGWHVHDRPSAGHPVVVVADAPPGPELVDRLAEVSAVLLLGPTAVAWAATDLVRVRAGLSMDRPGPEHEMRVRPGPSGWPVTARLGAELVVRDRLAAVDKAGDDVRAVLVAAAGLAVHPVATLRRDGDGAVGVLTLGTRPATLGDPAVHRLVHRMLRALLGHDDLPAIRVGLLGYGAIGHEHALAVAAVDGLELAAVADRNPDRVRAARELSPDLRGYDDAAGLLDDDAVDLVVVSTPPDRHADLTRRVLATGRHALVEKPFALTTADADDLIERAGQAGRFVGCYQNRRYDADYRALARVVRGGGIGDVVAYESFVGGFGHPCNYWHSDAAVSGGALFDWGSHYLDWLLDLLPGEVDTVTATATKRVWHDVTNADHSRAVVRFADGVEADFTHSDIAAAAKPKWWVVGTAGAVVGHWREVAVLSRDHVGALVEDRLAAADSPARLQVHHPDGALTTLALGPPATPYPFHRQLADHLLSGTPAEVTATQSRRVVAVLEAAQRSIATGRPARLP